MIGYIVFFGLVAAFYIAYILSPDPVPIRDLNDDLLASEKGKCESYIERRLYDALVSRGYSVSTQVSCGKYRIDLALVGPKIAIECDGKDYHSSPAQKEHDRRKNAYLRRHGWKVIRFTGSRINRDLIKVIQRIDKVGLNRQ